MSAKHTPGPWMVNDAKGRRWIETRGDDAIAQVLKDDCSRETFDANASLIAAAPDLLEALQGLIDDCGFGRIIFDTPAATRAREAIAKAIGGEVAQ